MDLNYKAEYIGQKEKALGKFLPPDLSDADKNRLLQCFTLLYKKVAWQPDWYKICKIKII